MSRPTVSPAVVPVARPAPVRLGGGHWCGLGRLVALPAVVAIPLDALDASAAVARDRAVSDPAPLRPASRLSGPRAWKVDRCRKAYRVEKRYQAEEQG